MGDVNEMGALDKDEFKVHFCAEATPLIAARLMQVATSDLGIEMTSEDIALLFRCAYMYFLWWNDIV